MSVEHSIVIIQGLNDSGNRQRKLIERVTSNWESRYNLTPLIYTVGWCDGGNFHDKLTDLKFFVDDLYEKQGKIPVIGLSAGGTIAVNVFGIRHYKISALGLVCSRLTVGPMNGYRSFWLKTRNSQIFADSVFLSETVLNSLSKEHKKQITTVRGIHDELVPPETSVVDGAKRNILVPGIEHIMNIGQALTVYSSSLIKSMIE